MTRSHASMVVILARVQTPHQSPTGRALAQSSGRPFSFTFTFFFILTSQGQQLFVILLLEITSKNYKYHLTLLETNTI